MPCTTIETCSMAGFSCGWLLQATFRGLSSQEGCSIEALPNYLPGVHQRKSSLGHSVLQKMLYLEEETTVSEPSSSDTLSGNTGKTNLHKIHHTMKTFLSVKHWEAQTPISKLKFHLRKIALQGWVEWPTLTLQGDLQEWGFGCGMEAPNVTSGWTDGSIPHEINFVWEALSRVPRLLLSEAPNG